jgi:uncharacterized protein
MYRWIALSLLALSAPVRADFNDGVFAYANGDYEKALQTFLPMAQTSNDPLAQYWLGMMHLKGQGVSEDPAEAVNWFTSSAKQGFANSQFKLAELYRDGLGLPQDFEAAYAWFAVANKLGHKRAAAGQTEVAGRLSETELAAADRLAEQFIKDYGKPPASVNTGEQPAPPANITLPPAGAGAPPQP